MGVNAGRFHGVGIRRVTAPTFSGQVTVKPPADLRSVAGLVLQSVSSTNLVDTSIFNVYSHTGALLFQIPIAGGPRTISAQLAAGTLANGFFGFDGATNPVSMKAPNGTRIYMGIQSMTNANFPSLHGNVGDLYFRQTTLANLVVAQCTVAGNPGTWTTIAN